MESTISREAYTALLVRCLRLESELHRVRTLAARMSEMLVTSSKLDPGQIREIRRLLRKKVPLTQIAQRFNVSHSSVAQISCGKTWWHVIDDE